MASALASTVMLLGFFYVLFAVALVGQMLYGCWQRARAAQLAAVARSRAARGAREAGSGRHADRIAACR